MKSTVQFLSAIALSGIALYLLGEAILFVNFASGPPVLTGLCLVTLWTLAITIAALLLGLAASEERRAVQFRNAVRRGRA
jgi:hypothetical protein